MNQENLDLYRSGVEILAKSSSTDIEFNSGPEHAMIVMENIFKSAKNQINILAGNFSDEVCTANESKYLPSLKEFLLNGGKINVLLTNYEEGPENGILKLLKQYSSNTVYKSNIVVKQTTQKLLDDQGNEVHLTTADGQIFRLEYDIRRFAAKFSFQRPNIVSAFDNFFNSLFSHSQATPIF